MAQSYRVVDLSGNLIEPAERLVSANSPEAAASQVLEMELVRSGAKGDLMARVYWQVPGHALNMVRLYRKVLGDKKDRRSGTRNELIDS